jgi:2-hydroxy-6-oxonona-2,4-dienedioate hydrolase
MSGVAAIIVVFVVVAVSVAGALLYRSYRSKQRHARAEIAAGGGVVRTAAGAIEYAERGDGARFVDPWCRWRL